MEENKRNVRNLRISVENAKLIGNDETDEKKMETPNNSSSSNSSNSSNISSRGGANETMKKKFGFDEKELNAKLTEVSDEAVHVMNKMSMKLRDLTNKIKAKSNNNNESEK